MDRGGLTRRQWLGAAAGEGLAAAAAPAARAAERTDPPREPFGYSLNTSTISGQNLPIVEEVEIAAKAGYQGFEPWTRELDKYVKEGGSLKDLGKRIRDHGLSVEDAIGFFDWIVDDDAKRRKGLEEAKRCMDMVQQIGGKRIAAPPVGATDKTADVALLAGSERYAALLEVGLKIGVVPQAEVWGFSKTLSRLGEAMLVVIESGHSEGLVLADVYHLHKGGSGFAGLSRVGGAALGIFHVNDYPEKPGRAEITDAYRVYPGDGVAPWGPMLRDLYASGFRGMLSLELFNRDYWKQDALLVARTGLEKLRTVVRAAFEPR
jgi:sugar phosphate isomerase/epimerase